MQIHPLLRHGSRLLTTLPLLALALTIACGGGGNGSPAPPPATITQFTATPEIISQGSSTVLTASYANGTGSVDQNVGALASGASITVTPATSQTYTLTVTGAGGSTSRSVQVQVVAPPVVPLVQAPSYGTAQVAGYSAAVPAQANCTYTWTLTGATLTAGGGTAQITFTAGDTGTAKLSCVVSNSAGSATGQTEVTVVAPPEPPVLSVPTVATVGLAIAASASTRPDCSLLWSFPAGSIQSGQGTGAIRLLCANIGDANLSVTAVNLAGTQSTPAAATLTFVPAPAINGFSAATPLVTTGDSVALTASFSGGSATLTPGDLPLTSGVAIAVAPTSTTRYTVTVANLAGQTLTQELTVTTVAPPMITSLSAPTTPSRLSQGIQVAATFSGGTAVINPGGHTITSGTPLTLLVPAASLIELTVTNAAGRSVKMQTGVYPGQSLAANPTRSYFLKDDGTVWVWGINAQQPFALPGADSSIPTQIAGISSVVSVASMENSAIALKADGSVWALEDSGITQLAVANIKAISGGASHAMALGADGSVWTWGSNFYGELGDGTIDDQSQPIQVPGLLQIACIRAGQYSSFAIRADGTVFGWGLNNRGQVGDRSLTDRRTPTALPGLTDVAALACNSSATFALKYDGTVWQWGRSWFGSTDDHTTDPPVRIIGATEIIAISGGYEHILALSRNGTLWSWGRNGQGQLGNGTLVNGEGPAQVPGLSNVLTAIAGGEVSLAILKDGTLQSWGDNSVGQLGDRDPVWQGSPCNLKVPLPLLAISGSTNTMLAVKPDGTVWGWGYSSGTGLPGQPLMAVSVPYQLPGLAGITQAGMAGSTQGMALGADGIRYWGVLNLVTGGLIEHQPKLLPEQTGITGFTLSYSNAFFLKTGGTVWGSGHNDRAQLGDGTTINRPETVQTPGLTGITALTTSGSHTLAIQNGTATPGLVWAWGWNQYSQVADDGNEFHTSPMLLPGLSHVVAVSTGWTYSLALKDDGTVFEWGRQSYYLPHYSVPRVIPELTGIVAISVGSEHAMALKADGTVWTWGENDFGQLGRPGATTAVPGQVPALAAMTGIHASASASYSFNSSKALAWGSDRHGELGLGRTLRRPSPAPVSGISLW